MPKRALLALGATLAIAGAAAFGPVLSTAAPASAAPLVATQGRPNVSVSPDGLTATDGVRTLQVGQAHDISAGGASIGVAGSGFDINKGIYVALCVVTPPDRAPSPCGGGIDQTGATGASSWISSNPPSYGQGLAIPYGAGGTFSVNISAAPLIADGFDCRQIQCAIVTRNDHVRTADRSQDIFIPVTFGAGQAPPPDTAPPVVDSTTTTTTTAPAPTTLAPPPPPSTTEAAPAPSVTVGDDGLSASDGTRTLRVNNASDLSPEPTMITVSGEAFNPAVGIQVTLCRVAADPTTAPTPCLAGSSSDASKVLVPTGQADESDLDALEADGSFEVQLEVAAVIDADTDCREVECAVTVRRFATSDDEREAAAADRTHDLALPVSFADQAPEDDEVTTTTEEKPAEAPPAEVVDDDGSSSAPLIAGVAVLAALGAAAAAVVVKKKKASAGASDGSDPGPGSENGPA